MPNELTTRPAQGAELSTIQRAGLAANLAASRNLFADYQQRRAANTLRRQRADLELFARYMGAAGVWDRMLDFNTPEAEALRRAKADDLQSTPEAWQGVTWGIVAGFREWQLQQGYAVASVSVRLSTVKKYAAMAFQAGIIDAENHALIRTVQGYTFNESKKVDEKRSAVGNSTRFDRKGAKKAESVTIPDDTAKTLKTAAQDAPQARRDALLMCLLLDHGLRCGEVALLKVGNFNLTDGTMTFYRPKVGKEQTHNLTPDTRRALKAWMESGDCPLLADAPILRGSTKGGKLTAGGMSERAITKRVAYLGASLGVTGMSAHDCRHYWATRASRKGTDPFALQEAGGWNSLAMPRRYVEAARIANAGVKLE